MEDDVIDLNPLVERKRKKWEKKNKDKADQNQRFGRVNRKQQMEMARMLDYDDEMKDY